MRRSRTGRSARKFAARVSGATERFLGRVGSNFSSLRGIKLGRPSSLRVTLATAASRRFVGRVSDFLYSLFLKSFFSYSGFLFSGLTYSFFLYSVFLNSGFLSTGRLVRSFRSATNFFARLSGFCESSIRALRSSGASIGRGRDAVFSWKRLARSFERSVKRTSFLETVVGSASEYRRVVAAARDLGSATAPLRAFFCAVVWRAFGSAALKAAAFFVRFGLPTDAARRAFPGAGVRGCRDIEMHTNRDDKRVSGVTGT